jgi:hypothetical protein
MKNSKMLEKTIVKAIGFARLHKKEIFAVLSGVGVVATAVSTRKATIKSIELTEEYEYEKQRTLTGTEKVLINTVCYIPTVVLGASSVACIYATLYFGKKQQVSMISSYSLITNQFQKYIQKVKDIYGEEAHQNIINSIAAEEAQQMHICSDNLFKPCYLNTDTKDEVALFYEEFTGRFFKATIQQVLNAEYHLNRNFTLRGYATLEEFHTFLGIEPHPEDESLGWAVEDEMYWIDFDHNEQTLEDGTKYYELNFPFYPDNAFLEYRWY